VQYIVFDVLYYAGYCLVRENCFPAPHGLTRSSHIRGQEGEQVLLAVG
jgi:hypothetical protein